MKVSKPLKILLIATFGILLTVLYKRFLLYSNYENPPPVITYSLIMEYLAFVMVGISFPWSYRLFQAPLKRTIFIVLVSLLFTLIYLLLLSYFEWLEAGQSYSWSNGFRFGLVHSSPYVLVIYGIVGLFLYFVNDRFQVPAGQFLQKLEVRKKNRVHLLPTRDIDLFESSGNYILAHDRGNQKHLIRKTIKNLEKHLDPDQFARIHRRFIVRIDSIKSYQAATGGGYILTLANGEKVRMSKKYIYQIQKFADQSNLH